MTNHDIHNYIWTMAKSRDREQKGHWIGGRYLEKEGRWQWSDGSKWEFTKWGTDQPNNAEKGDQYCLSVYNNHVKDGWNDVSCENVPKKFVCVSPICNNHHNNTNKPSSTNDGSKEKSEFPIFPIALPTGIILFVITVTIVICA